MQVYFMNNPITGLLILIALFVQNYRTATYGLIALVSSNLFAYALHFGHEMIDSGTYADVC
jgi:urea transporter